MIAHVCICFIFLYFFPRWRSPSPRPRGGSVSRRPGVVAIIEPTCPYPRNLVPLANRCTPLLLLLWLLCHDTSKTSSASATTTEKLKVDRVVILKVTG